MIIAQCPAPASTHILQAPAETWETLRTVFATTGQPRSLRDELALAHQRAVGAPKALRLTVSPRLATLILETAARLP